MLSESPNGRIRYSANVSGQLAVCRARPKNLDAELHALSRRSRCTIRPLGTIRANIPVQQRAVTGLVRRQFLLRRSEPIPLSKRWPANAPANPGFQQMTEGPSYADLVNNYPVVPASKKCRLRL